jgi:hypothetical protein
MWDSIACTLSVDYQLDPWNQARLLALLNITPADGYIAVLAKGRRWATGPRRTSCDRPLTPQNPSARDVHPGRSVTEARGQRALPRWRRRISSRNAYRATMFVGDGPAAHTGSGEFSRRGVPR